MSILEYLEGADYQVLPLSKFKLAARENDKPVAELATPGRRRVKDARVDPLENGADSVEFVATQHVLAPGGPNHDMVVRAKRGLHGPRSQDVLFEKGVADGK